MSQTLLTIWYKYNEITYYTVIDSNKNVAELKNGIRASVIVAFLNGQEFNIKSGDTTLREETKLCDANLNKNNYFNPLLIQIVSSNSVTAVSALTERKRRFQALNVILDAEIQVTLEKGKFSSITRNKILRSFPMSDLVVIQKQIPPENLDALYEQLIGVHKLYGIPQGGKSKRFQFVSPILNAVCMLLAGVTIKVDEDAAVVNFNATIQFSYIIHYHNKKVCIAVAKNDDLELGMVQSLIGSEIIAETESSSIVYTVVTNYIQWLFYKNTDNCVFKDDLTLSVQHNIPDKNSVDYIASYILGILTEISDTNLNDIF